MTSLAGAPRKRSFKPRAPIAWTGVAYSPDTGVRTFITVPELALRAGVATRKVWEWVAADRVHVVRWGRRTTRITVAEAERFLAAGGW